MVAVWGAEWRQLSLGTRLSLMFLVKPIVVWGMVVWRQKSAPNEDMLGMLVREREESKNILEFSA